MSLEELRLLKWQKEQLEEKLRLSEEANRMQVQSHDLMIERLEEKLREATEALENIQNANGSPNDEDYVTTEAREALTKIGGNVAEVKVK